MFMPAASSVKSAAKKERFEIVAELKLRAWPTNVPRSRAAELPDVADANGVHVHSWIVNECLNSWESVTMFAAAHENCCAWKSRYE